MLGEILGSCIDEYAISGGPGRFLSDVTNDVILASRRRIQFMDTGNTSDPHRCEISPGAHCPGKSHAMTLPHVQLRFPRRVRLLTRSQNNANRPAGSDCISTVPIPPNHLRVPKTSLSLPPVRHERVSLYMSCVNVGCCEDSWFDADLFISTFREFSKRRNVGASGRTFPRFALHE